MIFFWEFMVRHKGSSRMFIRNVDFSCSLIGFLCQFIDKSVIEVFFFLSVLHIRLPRFNKIKDTDIERVTVQLRLSKLLEMSSFITEAWD